MRAFQERHRSLADRVERLLMQLVILGLVGLVVVQTLQISSHFRRLANRVEALEGIPWNQVLAWQSEGDKTWDTGGPIVPAASSTQAHSVSIMLVSRPSAPNAWLLVDGQPVAAFGRATAVVEVAPGQRIDIDGSAYSQPLTFRVVGAPGLAQPVLGQEVTTRADRKSLGTVEPAR